MSDDICRRADALLMDVYARHITVSDRARNKANAPRIIAAMPVMIAALCDEVRRLRVENDHNTATAIRAAGERDAARYAARILAHAYRLNNYPPDNIVADALAFPVTP